MKTDWRDPWVSTVRFVRSGLIAIALLSFAVPASAQKQDLRPLTFDDLLRLEQFGGAFGEPPAFSPDGTSLAYVRLRPWRTAAVYNQPYLAGYDRADIWLVSTGGGEPVNLTNGRSDGVGSWGPSWSPDSRHLALLSTRGDNVHLYIWDRETERLDRVSERGIDLGREPIWLSDTEIVFSVLPEDKRPQALSILRLTPEIATEAWPKVREGEEPTSSVLQSGIPIDMKARPHGQLLLYDADSGETTVLYDGDVQELTPSPDKERVAALAVTGVFLPQPDRPLIHQARHGEYGIQVVDREGLLPTSALDSVKVIPGSLRWARDGDRFAFAGSIDAPEESAARVYVFTPSTGVLEAYPLGDLSMVMPAGGYVRPPKIRWAVDGRLLVYARPAEKERADWWLIGESGQQESLTDALSAAPAEVYRASGSDALLGISEGDVWRLPTGSSKPTNLTADFADEISGFAWVDEEQGRTEGISEVLVQVSEGDGETSLYRLDVGGAASLERVRKPSRTAELVEFSHATGLALFSASDRTGTYAWLTRPGSGEPRPFFEANRFLRNIADAETRLIKYRGLDGDSLLAWLLLPIDYVEGRSYPLVTWVYASSRQRETGPTSLADLNQPHPLNLQLLTARGYAVLLPSMPLPPPGQPGDLYMELTKGVLPAVDKAIDLGIADPDRLAVMGQSTGGYSTYGLITQTDRFDAAIALAGYSDLVSLYGQLSAWVRYTDYAQETLFFMSISESGQLRMGSPPWEDLQRYIRNSPLSYVHRVETPLLMLQGDLDFAAMQQGEQFFQSLYRQDKRAKFVRYWGEGHVLSSPANIRDMWHHIFGWLDEHLKDDKNPGATAREGDTSR